MGPHCGFLFVYLFERRCRSQLAQGRFLFNILSILAIIYLTRQPVREGTAPCPGANIKLRFSRLFFAREQGGYFL